MLQLIYLKAMIEREQKLLLDQLKHYLEHNRQSFEEFEKSPEFEKVKAGKYEEAQQRVLTSLVLGAIIKAEDISVAEEELESHLEEIYSAAWIATRESLFITKMCVRQALEELLTAKVLEFLLQNAKISYTTISSADKPVRRKVRQRKRQIKNIKSKN